MGKMKLTTHDSEQTTERLLYCSAVYGALSLAFHAPTTDSFKVLTSNATRSFILQAASFLDRDQAEHPWSEPESLQENRSVNLVQRAEKWVKTFLPLDLDALLTGHGRLFGHTARGAVAPYETEYGQDGLFQQSQQLANLNGFYHAFGLKVRQVERERPDHIACQLEFLEFLSRKQAYALEHSDDSMFQASSKAKRLFLKEHLGRFGRAFGYGLKKQDPEGFLGMAGDFLFDFVTLECRRLQIEAGPSQLPLRSPAEDNVPMACAGETDLVQIET
ncbi:molecular chaperone TorD family protein [Acidobacteria bacterium AH-259-D05]|nr:molecular chaperone TorD family protein [Acidobacteria bacterium AH-259-D05]